MLIHIRGQRMRGLYLLLVSLVALIAVCRTSSIEDLSLKLNKSHPKTKERLSTMNRVGGASNETHGHNGIKTPVPVIGVITQVLRDYKRFVDTHHLHLPSSYVKWIESAGAQVLPIMLNQNDAYYERIFNQTNGLLFPGGDNLLDPHKNTPMMVAAKKLYKLALEANERGDYYPIWGTCLGLELLSVLSSGVNTLESCNSVDKPLKMRFVERGKMFEPNENANMESLNDLDYSKLIMDTLKLKPVTYNYHRKCLTYDGLKRANLEHFYKPLAYSDDTNGIKFIAIMEAFKYPFFGVQFHPEKPPFEFTQGEGHRNVPHSRESIEVSRYFADFFVRKAQQNDHRTEGNKQLETELIYSHNPMYTAPLGDLYEQRYLFPFDENQTRGESIEHREGPLRPLDRDSQICEFVEHIPGANEEIPEDVNHTLSLSR